MHYVLDFIYCDWSLFTRLFVRDDVHMTSMNCPTFKTPTPLVHLRPQFFHTLDLGRPISTEPPLSLQMITSQLKENIIQGLTLYVISSFLQVGFRFLYQINQSHLVWLPFDFFSFSWSLTICFLVALYLWVCRCSKYYEMSFIYNYSHF